MRAQECVGGHVCVRGGGEGGRGGAGVRLCVRARLCLRAACVRPAGVGAEQSFLCRARGCAAPSRRRWLCEHTRKRVHMCPRWTRTLSSRLGHGSRQPSGPNPIQVLSSSES